MPGNSRRRRTMPWGKHKGVRIQHVPDAYLSWLGGLELKPEWDWLRAMIDREMRRRGLRAEIVEGGEDGAPAAQQSALDFSSSPRRRKIRLA